MMIETKTHKIAAGIRLSLRNEDFWVTDVKKNIIEDEGISKIPTAHFFQAILSVMLR